MLCVLGQELCIHRTWSAHGTLLDVPINGIAVAGEWVPLAQSDPPAPWPAPSLLLHANRNSLLARNQRLVTTLILFGSSFCNCMCAVSFNLTSSPLSCCCCWTLSFCQGCSPAGCCCDRGSGSCICCCCCWTLSFCQGCSPAVCCCSCCNGCGGSCICCCCCCCCTRLSCCRGCSFAVCCCWCSSCLCCCCCCCCCAPCIATSTIAVLSRWIL